MRPAYRFALASAAGLALVALAWLWAAAPEPPGPPPRSPPTTVDVAGGAPGTDQPGTVARPPTREEALQQIQRAEEAELGAAEAERRRRVREQMLDARARHLH